MKNTLAYSSEKMRASSILAKEVFQCISKRLEKKEMCLRRTSLAPASFDRYGIVCDVLAGGMKVASLSVKSWDQGADLFVMAEQRDAFHHRFKLYKTDSPRRVACLLVQWLKNAQVRQVMQG